MDPLFEKKIIAGMIAKEGWAFEKFVENYQKDIYNLALKYTSNQEDALDITQEVLLRILRKIETFKGNSKLSTWVYRITVNYCKDYISKHRKIQNVSIDKPVENSDGVLYMDIEDPEKKPLEVVEETEQKQLLHKCIAMLDSDQREIIILRYINELSYDEIEQILKIPEGTIKSRLNRGRKKLAKLLQEQEP
ncbi:RNA polymerase sigma factor [Alkalicella caledoniensis]|uniref:RNA polymerase sigma factor n=1 Tax=Alkalicella caledoniensis TaxID=2731377 RepID=A0A7G9WAH1_ALKCA|nr:RNA polymerase sigma factor [Alkalicella caledoniensis]QNO15683.1 RNA polymerase sigma factor [Alkalicella caledoniensis]